ncbi:hypothetical protein ACIBOZ_00685 [Streptomyces anulatus]
MAIGDSDLTRMDRDDLGRLADMLPGLKWGSGLVANLSRQLTYAALPERTALRLRTTAQP